ncbi:MAG: cation acetate symporter [Burkholderiales bacterium]|nr:cation acetate symporter [Burkholderiales bacterium]
MKALNLAALKRFFLFAAIGLLLFLLTLDTLAREGMPRSWIGYFFLFGTTFAYAGIGLRHRSSNIEEFYVAGRRVPAFLNGMATAADWVSAATFISLTGGLFATGFNGLAYVIGWTGGFCLLALFIAPYLRKFGQFSIADFLAARYACAPETRWFRLDLIRLFAASATILISFIYVIAQIYAVGLITSRFIGVDFTTGIFLGLASILVCSFLGGMRSVTWTQILQYLILLAAFLLPTMWLSIKHNQGPVPQLNYGKVLQHLSQQEAQLNTDAREIGVRQMHAAHAAQLTLDVQNLPQSWQQGRSDLLATLAQLRQSNAPLASIREQELKLANYPKSAQKAKLEWQREAASSLARAAPVLAQVSVFPKDAALQSNGELDSSTRHSERNNFLALVACLMLGTCALPHILIRSYTVPNVQASRNSMFWTLFFIALLYLSIPALAVLIKFDLLQNLVGLPYNKLPSWVGYWSALDRVHPVLQITDINHDGIVQWGEIWIDPDILVLASPELAGLPSVFSGLIAVGALAAALSTADGLLLAMSNSLSHDVYFHMLDRHASEQKRVTISKLLLLAVAFFAAYAASLRPADILSLVGAAFSLAAATLFPVLVAAIFWRRANRAAALCAMATGALVCLMYMLRCHPALGGNVSGQWWHIAPISAGIFALPAATLSLIVVSWLTPAPSPACQQLVTYLRQPDEFAD